MVRCRACKSAAEVLQNYCAMGARIWQVKCNGCGRATKWHFERAAAEVAWREMNRAPRRRRKKKETPEA